LFCAAEHLGELGILARQVAFQRWFNLTTLTGHDVTPTATVALLAFHNGLDFETLYKSGGNCIAPRPT
jgi:hypothetical protein